MIAEENADMAVQRPPSHPSTRVLRFVLFAALSGWLVFLTVALARQPEPGAPSREALADAVAAALNARDTATLALLLGDPVAGDTDVARHLADQAAGPHEGPWRVSVAGDRLVLADDRGPRARFAAVEARGRWLFHPLPTFTAGN
nr:hypothetical protein GCM10017745_44910 [Saccharothrix mutabilis subsp. capreolus]